MADLLIDKRDVEFVLFDLLKVQDICAAEKYSAFSDDIFEMILSEALKFAETELFPLNLEGDKKGAHFEKGNVSSTPGTKEAYQAFVESGWLTPSESEELGGQGMPHSIMTAVHEMFFAANFPFMCYVNLTHDAAKLIELFGSDEQKRLYMEPMYAGQWTGTMALTEPNAGTDVGAIKTKAIRRDDGNYSIQGTKIFITNGEHDISDNIVHLVLARIEGDPEGTKGLSLFVVPKYRVNESDGSIAEANDVKCFGIEEKMGLHASPTTSMSFGEDGNCVGYLLGQERQGIMIMFHMMNSSRLEVGIWGQGTASASYLHALQYSKEREQGQSISDPDPSKKVPIIQHPDIRRVLLMMKSHVEGMRAMTYYCSYLMDQVAVAEDADEKKRLGRIIDLMIPVCKGYPTEKGVDIAGLAIQTHGGYGFSSEYAVQQFFRDAKVGCIFEGTTAVQAMDLAFRKLAMGKGQVFADFLAGMDDIIAEAKGQADWKAYAEQLEKAKVALADIPAVFSAHMADGRKHFPYLKANLFLETFGDVIVAWFLLRSAFVAREKLNAIFAESGVTEADAQNKFIAENEKAAFYAGKLHSAKFFIGNVIPITMGKIESCKWEDSSAWEIAEGSF